MRVRFSCFVVLFLCVQLAAPAQSNATLPSFFTKYNYVGYTVYDTTTGEPPTVVRGVGGSLTLFPAGTYEKRLSIVGPNGPVYFNQTGTFVLTGDSIRFAFTDLKGADVQRGTFQLKPASRRLTLTIFGYPAGNKGVYELVAADAKPQSPRRASAPRSKTSPKPRR